MNQTLKLLDEHNPSFEWIYDLRDN